MEFIILGLLLLKEMTIYEMNSQFKGGLALIYAASYGSLQNGTRKLLKNQLIDYRETVEKGRMKKIYSITDKGQEAFYSWMEGSINPQKLEVTMLSKVYFLGLVECTEKKISIIKNIREVATATKGEMEALRESLSSLNLGEKEKKIGQFQFKTLDYGILAHQTGLSWLWDLHTELENTQE